MCEGVCVCVRECVCVCVCAHVCVCTCVCHFSVYILYLVDVVNQPTSVIDS